MNQSVPMDTSFRVIARRNSEGKVQEGETSSCRAADERGSARSGMRVREKPKGFLPALFTAEAKKRTRRIRDRKQRQTKRPSLLSCSALYSATRCSCSTLRCVAFSSVSCSGAGAMAGGDSTASCVAWLVCTGHSPSRQTVSLRAQQSRFDNFRYVFNNERVAFDLITPGL